MELVCCVCGKVKRNGSWEKTPIREHMPLSHGYCTECMHNALRELHEFQASAENKKKLSVA